MLACSLPSFLSPPRPQLAYPHEARRTPREQPIAIRNLPFPPRARPAAARVGGGACGTGRGGTLDVVVEALDDVTRARLFEVRGLVAVDLVFEGGLEDGRGQKDGRVCLFVGWGGWERVLGPCSCLEGASSAAFLGGRA